ncbi:MAG: MFS transporter [Clostridiales bacterium]|jgi:MFS family permease|nr:MFS transporter [Clostridiales bacterium]
MQLLNAFARMFSNAKKQFFSLDEPVRLYAYEGLLIAIITNLINNNNNLFASRLGAEDFQLGLLNLAPQLTNMIILLPGGVLIDSMKNKRKMVIFSLGAAAFFYASIGFVTSLGGFKLPYFIMLLSASVGMITVYSLSWQSLFPEVIEIEKRNRTLTLRTFMTMTAGIAVPLATGLLLSAMKTNDQKIGAHQGFFIASAALIVIQILIFKKITPLNPASPRGVSFRLLAEAAASIFKSKKFVFYAAVAWFFYITWQLDWTLYYIGQTKYILLNEAQLSFTIIGSTLAQFLTLSFWSKSNERRGPVFSMIFGILGLCLNPLCMIISTILPSPANKPLFILMNTLASLTLATIALNPFQCLLQVLDDKYKTLGISMFTVLTSLSNAVMPMAGVLIYEAFGSSAQALRKTFLIVLSLRLVAAGLWLFRWRRIRSYP